MSRPKLLPDVQTMLRWRDEEGLSQAQIRDRVNEQNRQTMGSEYQPVSRSAVSVALTRAGKTGDGRARYDEAIPWSPIAPEHHNDPTLVKLRTWARIERGDDTVPPRARRSFETFKAHLDATDHVMDYSPETGFTEVKRRPGIDTGLIRLTDKQVQQRGLQR